MSPPDLKKTPDPLTLDTLPVANSAAAPTLVNADGVRIDNDWVVLAEEDLAPAGTHVVLSFERALSAPGTLAGNAVRILPGDDVRRLVPYLDQIALIEISFPAFRDGRGYSSARILREEGYTGPLRAVGDVLRDQLLHMLRCGIDQFLIKDKTPEAALAEARQRFEFVYQSAADTRRPVWSLRNA